MPSPSLLPSPDGLGREVDYFKRRMQSWLEKATGSAIDYARDRLGRKDVGMVGTQ